MTTKILFLLPYPLHRAPSQRFRVENYFFLLKEKNIHFETVEFLNEQAWKVLYTKGSLLKKIISVLKGYVKRLQWVLFKARKFDYIFIHREAAPLGPPVFEWWLKKILNKKIIYDFDDAIWIPNISAENKVARSLKAYWKIKYIIKWSYKVSAGNEFLASYARRYNSNVVYNPTCVDVNSIYNSIVNQNVDPVNIGWTGSHSTIQFLSVGIPAIRRLEEKERFNFVIICDQKPDFNLKATQFIPWRKDSEIEDLSTIQIGIMPLKDDTWSEGKCGFKIIQYMALGIPAVASPIGVNQTIIEHGVNGYLCNTEEEWVRCLSELLHDKNKREQFGKAGRRKIELEYSISSNSKNFLNLFI